MKPIRHNGGTITERRKKNGTVSYHGLVCHDYKQIKDSFPTLRDCKIWIDSIQIDRANSLRPLTPSQIVEYRDAVKALDGSGGTLIDAARYWATHHRKSELSEMTSSAIFSRFIEEKRSAGLRLRSIQSLQTNIGRLTQEHGQLKLTEISSEMLSRFLAKLGVKGRNREHIRMDWINFFNWCIKRGSIATNPAAGITKTMIDSTTPKIWKADEVLRFMESAKKLHPKLIPYYAIGFYAGLRTSEIMALDWEQIGPKTITVRPEVSKARRQRHVTIQPILEHWIAAHRAKQGKVFPIHKAYLWAKTTEICNAAKVKFSQNVARHSWASHHLQRFKNAALTAMEMGHTANHSVLWDHYRELVTDEDAERYFA